MSESVMFSYSSGLELWRTYSEKTLDASTGEERIVTDYGAYFTHPESELGRVLAG